MRHQYLQCYLNTSTDDLNDIEVGPGMYKVVHAYTVTTNIILCYTWMQFTGIVETPSILPPHVPAQSV